MYKKILHPGVQILSNLPKNSNEGYIPNFNTLSEKNGILNLVETGRKFPFLKLKVAGMGELEQEVKFLIKKEKIENVTLYGFVKEEPLKELIANSLFTLYPALCYHNCPMGILESFALGKPVIGSNIGSIPELIEDGKTGLLFEPGNVEDLTKKILLLYQDKDLRERLGKNALRKAKEHHSLEEYYSSLVKIYESLLNSERKTTTDIHSVSTKAYQSPDTSPEEKNMVLQERNH